MFIPGDVVKIFSPTASKPKYHLCICYPNGHGRFMFLYFNSKNNYESDYVLKNEEVSCIPACDSGLTIVSCSLLVPYTKPKLELFKAEKIGELDRSLVSGLLEFVSETKALTRLEKRMVIDGLSKFAAGTGV